MQRRDGTEAWGIGYVTQLEPLKVNMSETDPTENGYRWDEVRPYDGDEEEVSPGKGRGAQLWRRTRMAMAMVVGLPMTTGVAVFDRARHHTAAPAVRD